MRLDNFETRSDLFGKIRNFRFVATILNVLKAIFDPWGLLLFNVWGLFLLGLTTGTPHYDGTNPGTIVLILRKVAFFFLHLSVAILPVLVKKGAKLSTCHF